MIGNKKKAGTVFEYKMFTDFDEPKTTWHFKRAYLTRQQQLGEEIRQIESNDDGLSSDKLGEEVARAKKEYILEHCPKLTDVLEVGDEMIDKDAILKLVEEHCDIQDIDEGVNAISFGPAKMENIFGGARAALAEERKTKNASS